MPESELQVAARVLRGGGVVAHASEGVWGLACDPFDEDAVAKVLAIKGRDVAKGLIVIGADAGQFATELASLDCATAARVRASWPGAVTWLVANRRYPKWITGAHSSVAIRVPGHEQARALAASFGAPLVSTSANRAGGAPALSAEEVVAVLGAEVDHLLPGETGGSNAPSRIIDAATGAVLR